MRDIGDVRLALDGAFDTAPGQEVTSVTSSGWARALALASAAAVLAGLAVAFVGWTLWPQPRPLSVVRLADQVPIAVREGTANFRSLALSQDGRYIAYSTGSGLFLRAMDQPEGRLLPLGSGGRSQPFFSPDGRSLGFLGGGFTTRQLMRIAVDGEAPVVIADVGENVEDMFWARDNTILYSGRLGLYQVAAGGATPALVIAAGEGQRLIAPQLLADGETVLFTIESEDGTALVAVQSLASEERTIVVERGGQARQLPTGHLVYLLDGNLFAVGFDEATWTTSGVPVSVASGIRDRYSVTDGGTLAYLSGGGSSQSQLVWVDAEGQDSALGLVPGDYSSPRLSPDETRVMLQTGEGISIYSLGRGTLERIADGLEGAWSPDSTAMAYIRDGLWRVPVNETDEAERMATLEEGLVVAWSPDGMKLVFLATDAVDPDPEVPAGDLGVVDLAGEGAVTVLRETPAREDGAWISPDGRWIAVESILESESEILVWPFGDGGNGRWQISTSGGWDALWSRSGDALFYRQDREIMKVSITGDDPSEWSRPEVLFELDDEILANSGPRQIDLASDGRFLMLKSVGDENSQTRSIVVLNWFQELLERVPVD